MKLTDKIKIGLHSLVYGMKGGDEVITQEANYGSEGGTNIIQEKTYGGVFADMIQQKETQEVKEMRDSYYRILKEADKYVVGISGKINEETGDFEGSSISGTVRKKLSTDYSLKLKILNEENYEIRTIQDIKLISLQSNFAPDFSVSEEEQYVPNISIERDDFMPRFKLEVYANKLVARRVKDNKFIVDFYTTMYASQFGKIDALYIAELNNIYNNKILRSDTTTIKSIDFVTDKAFGEGIENGCCFKFNNILFRGINIFDGNFVLSFECDCVVDGKYIGDIYRTEELTEKYNTNAPKPCADLRAIQRKLEDDDNLTSTTLKIS